MKKVINGKMYNTETAREIDSYSYGYPRDFSHVYERLFQKKTGEFFIAGEGGPASKYAERVDGNTRSGGSDIRPLTTEQAMRWLEEHSDADTIESVFGEIPE